MISVIIPTYRDWKTLNECLKQLRKQTISKDLFEIIIVNNDPSDIIPEYLDLTENTRVFTEEKAGSYAARNKGILEAKGEILAFTDSDCLPSTSWLEEIVKVMTSNEDIDMVGGDIQVYKLPAGHSSAYLFEKHYAFKQKMNVERYGKSVTANLIVRKSVFEKLGLFNEAVFSGEDTRWTSMAVSKGCKLVYSDRVQVLHPARLSIQELILKRRRTIGGYYNLHYKSLSKGTKVKSHFVAALAPIKTMLTLTNISFLERIKVLFLKWRIEWEAFRELIYLSRNSKDQLRT